MTEFTPISALAGGFLIGLGALVLLLTHGRIAGISGLAQGALFGRGSGRSWRIAFLLALIATGAAVYWLTPARFGFRTGYPLLAVIGAGLLVGFGTALGSGCTSGHGVCGVSRLAPRSLAATALFMLTGILTASVLRHLIGLAP